MSDSRPTESLIEEVAADAAAAYDDLESDAEGEEEEEGFDDDQIEVDAATIDGGR